MLEMMNAIGRSKESGQGNGEANWCILHKVVLSLIERITFD